MRAETDKLSSAAAVIASFCAFLAASGGLSSAFPAVPAVLPYLGGWLCAVGILKLSARLLPDRDAEEERAVFGEGEGIETHKYSVMRDAYASAAVLAVLLALNFSLPFFADGTPSVPSAAVLVTGGILKPFCEESYFRYGITVTLMRGGRHSRIAAIAVSAVLFALIHKAHTMPFALAAGAALGFLATRHTDGRDGFRRGAVCSFAVHAAYNLILYLVLYRRYI